MTINMIARNQMGPAMMRVSSGFRVNSAADDAAGLAIIESMTAQVRGFDQGTRNTMDMQALVNTAEGGMNTISESLNRVRELSVQALNDTNSPAQREMIQLEIDQLTQHIEATSENLQFNSLNLLDGSVQNANTAASPDGTGPQISIGDMADVARAITAVADGSFDLDAIDSQQGVVVGERAVLGAASNRMEYIARSNTISSLNLVDARSRIADADMAGEMLQVNQERVLNEIQVLLQQRAQENNQNNSLRVLQTGA